MNILVTGSSGLIGSALVPALAAGGHKVRRLARKGSRPGAPGEDFAWDPAKGEIDRKATDDLDAAVHLAGENIAAGRWTADLKARIRDSRLAGTRLLAEALASSSRPPRTLVCASAIGYYGDRGAEVLREDSPAGTGFLADVCRAWEEAAAPARERGVRVVHLRIGVVLSPRGGALATMLVPFKLGLGGKVGPGTQYWSWISIDDVVGAFLHALNAEGLKGPVNCVAPGAVTNAEFTRALGRVLHRPTLFPMPAFAARLALGEMADALLLASTRVEPAKLTASGYAFRHPQLEGALRAVLGK